MALNLTLTDDKYVVAGLIAALGMLAAMYVGGQAGQIAFSASARKLIEEAGGEAVLSDRAERAESENVSDGSEQE